MSFIPDKKPYEGGWASKRVLCVRADNASPMTHTGTNTFLVRKPTSKRCMVLDPAPAGQHIEKVLDACAREGLEIAAIAVTHHHADHTEGVAQLVRETGAPAFVPSGELLRRFAAGEPCCAGSFDAAEEAGSLADGGNMPEGAFTPFDEAPAMRLVALPGHSSDSVGILLEDERLLFTGDVLFNHGPTVVFHPDGQLGAYLRSLDALEALVREGRAARFLPAHGWPIEDPLRIIAATRAHRLERLRQIEDALATGVPANPDALFDVVYQGVDPRLRPASIRSIQAQLEYLGLL